MEKMNIKNQTKLKKIMKKQPYSLIFPLNARKTAPNGDENVRSGEAHVNLSK